jgi:hypothetical protein
MLLAQILIKDGSYDAARPHVEYFKRKGPTNPEIIKMDLQLSLPSNAPSAAGASEPFVPPPVPPPVQ